MAQCRQGRVHTESNSRVLVLVVYIRRGHSASNWPVPFHSVPVWLLRRCLYLDRMVYTCWLCAFRMLPWRREGRRSEVFLSSKLIATGSEAQGVGEWRWRRRRANKEKPLIALFFPPPSFRTRCIRGRRDHHQIFKCLARFPFRSISMLLLNYTAWVSNGLHIFFNNWKFSSSVIG